MPKNKHYRDVNGHVMSVWDPNDDVKKTAVFSQIKSSYLPVSGFKDMGGRIHPGVLTQNG